MESSNSGFQYIASEEELRLLLPRLEGTPQVALDTEADSMHHYQEKVCLIQMSFQEQNFIVDPLAGVDLSPLMELLKKKELIFHAADYDLRLLRKAYDFHPGKPVFDTMLAARLLGYEEIGLAALVLRFFGVDLPKEGQKADWSQRPLSPALLKYASDDTYYLEKMTALLKEQLIQSGRLSWHEEWCRRTVDAAAKQKKTEPDAEWRVKGVGKLKSRAALAYMKALWLWREKEAERVDRPPFKILSSEKMIEISAWCVAHSRKITQESLLKSLQKHKLLPRHMPDARLQRFEEALIQVRSMPEQEYPQFLSKERLPYDPQAKEWIEAVKEKCKKIAESLKLDPSIIASRASIEAIVYRRAFSPDQMMKQGALMTWQAALVEPVVQSVIGTSKVNQAKRT